MPQHPNHRRACIRNDDRVVCRLLVEHVGHELRMDQRRIAFLAFLFVALQVFVPLCELRFQVARIRFFRDQRH